MRYLALLAVVCMTGTCGAQSGPDAEALSGEVLDLITLHIDPQDNDQCQHYGQRLDELWNQIESDGDVSLPTMAMAVLCSLRYGACSPNEIDMRVAYWCENDPENAFPRIIGAANRNRALDRDNSLHYLDQIEFSMFCDDYIGEFLCARLERGKLELNLRADSINATWSQFHEFINDLLDYFAINLRGTLVIRSLHNHRDVMTLMAEAVLMRAWLQHEVPTIVRIAYLYHFGACAVTSEDGRVEVHWDCRLEKVWERSYRDENAFPVERQTRVRQLIRNTIDLDWKESARKTWPDEATLQELFDKEQRLQYWLKRLRRLSDVPGAVGERPRLAEWAKPPDATPKR